MSWWHREIVRGRGAWTELAGVSVAGLPVLRGGGIVIICGMLPMGICRAVLVGLVLRLARGGGYAHTMGSMFIASEVSMKNAILPFEGKVPVIHLSCFIAPMAAVSGDVVIGENSAIWFNCVVRGDVNEIRIGRDTNIQDGTVIHVATHGQGSYIGDRVTVGHMALIHACTIEDDGFVGMQACVMDGARIESGAMLAAGSLLTPGKVVPRGQLWAGRPARYVRDINDDDRKLMEWSWAHYVKLARRHMDSIGQ